MNSTNDSQGVLFQGMDVGSILGRLIDADRLNELGPGTPNKAFEPALRELKVENLGQPVVDVNAAKALQAGLWLLHDFFEPSHQISQELATPAGSYWHAILHRREPDAGNSKYWFHRVGRSPVFERLQMATQERYGSQIPATAPRYLREGATWDPFAFVDWVERCRGRGNTDEGLARRIQRLEWDLLFAECYRQAFGV